MDRTRFDDFFAPMAEILDLAEDEVGRAARYLRKERLIAAGKPGPGGGAAYADLQGLTNLLIGLVATDARMMAGRAAPEFIELKRVGPIKGWLPGKTFSGALMAALAMPSHAARIAQIVITREPVASAAIVFTEARDGTMEQQYTVSGEASAAPAIGHQVRLDGRAVQSLSLLWRDLPKTPADASKTAGSAQAKAMETSAS